MLDIFVDLKNTTINTHINTDTFFQSAGPFKTEGLLNSSIEFVLERHIKNRKMWALFAKQFKLFSDSANNGWRGEYWGKMMRGAVEFYKYTHDMELYNILTETVEELLSFQDKHGRFSTYEVYNEFGNWDMWCRKYAMLGLEYYYDICGDAGLKEKISLALCKHLDYIISKIGADKRDITSAGIAKLKGLNSCSILEPVVRLYNITSNQKYLDFAQYIVDTGATRGENIFKMALNKSKYPYEFSVTKAYEMMSCFEGLLELYRATGIEWYRQSAINFVDMIAETDITVIGGSGCHHEFFDNSAKTQTDPTITLLKNETCVTVTWIKLCAQLLCLTGDVKYAEWIEKSGYNALLGAVNTEECLFDFEAQERYHAEFSSNKTNNGITDNGMPFDSYSPLLAGFRGRGIGGLKAMQGDTYYGCCASIGAVGLGLFANMSAVYTKNGIAVNFYNCGEYCLKTPEGSDIKLEILSQYPANGEVSIKLSMPKAEELSLYLRIPQWCGSAEIYVNKECYFADSGYFEIKRLWCNGDTITFDLYMPLEVAFQDEFASVQYGPLTLARDERFGDSIDEPVSFMDADIRQLDAKKRNAQIFFSCEKGGKNFYLCDYASAGKNWHNGKRIAAWFPISKHG